MRRRFSALAVAAALVLPGAAVACDGEDIQDVEEFGEDVGEEIEDVGEDVEREFDRDVDTDGKDDR